MPDNSATFDTAAAAAAEPPRSRGLRATSARVTVLTDLPESGHATAEQLYGTLVPRLPGLNLVTVCRTLDFADRAKRSPGRLGPSGGKW